MSAVGVVVIDPVGKCYEALDRAALGVPLERLTHLNGAQLSASLAVLAAYGHPDWVAVRRLVARMRTLIITTSRDRGDALRAISSRAHGYLDANADAAVLRRDVHAVLAGEIAYPRSVLADYVRTQLYSPVAVRASRLTARQREVVGLIAQGATDKEIARALGISTATAEKHVTNVLHKLGVPNRAAAAAAATPVFEAEPSTEPVHRGGVGFVAQPQSFDP